MTDLKTKGLNFINVQQDDFRKKLAGTSFYSEWKSKYGAAPGTCWRRSPASSADRWPARSEVSGRAEVR
jgi:hypothetical protein